MKTLPFALALCATLAITLAFPLPGFSAPDKKGKSQPAAESTKSPDRPGKKMPESKPSESKSRPASVAQPRMETRPFLGVATSPIAPVLRDHLEIPEGFGIQIEFVVEDSPAEKAGLRPKDLLTRFEDQMLTTPEHLALLVRSKKKGDSVEVTFIRKGKETNAKVTLGETKAPLQPQWPRTYGKAEAQAPLLEWRFNGRDMPSFEGKEIESEIRRYQDRIQEWMEKQQPQRFQPRPPQGSKPQAGAPEPPQPALPLPGKTESRSESRVLIMPGKGSEGKPPAISVRPGFPVSVFSGNSMIRIDNPEGEVSIQGKDGKHEIKIVNADGETVYEGDYHPEKGNAGLPEEARKQLEKMKLDDLKMLGVPKAGAKAESKTEIKIEVGTSESKSTSPTKKKSDKGDLL